MTDEVPGIPRLNQAHKKVVEKAIADTQDFYKSCLRGLGMENPNEREIEDFMAEQLRSVIAINIRMRLADAMGIGDVYLALLRSDSGEDEDEAGFGD